MRIPQSPPDFLPLLSKLFQSTGEFSRIHRSTAYSATVDGRYVHWDKLRHLPLPSGIENHQMWWAIVQLNRLSLFRELPFMDRSGSPFKLALPDPLLRQLTEIDRDLSGRVPVPDQLVNSATRDRFLMSALIEEAITSSQLEGAATAREVAREMLRSGRSPRDQHERMIFHNFGAMRFIRSVAEKDLTPELIFEIHSRITKDTLDDPRDAGTLRDCDISVEDRLSGVEVHRGPDARCLPLRMTRLCDFANDKGTKLFIHPLVKAVLLHFFLAYDHPFVDGNGRTARALFYWSMLHSGYRLCEFLSISHILAKAPSKYSKAYLYTETDQNDVTYFVLDQLTALQRAIRSLHEYVRSKVAEMERTQHLMRKAQSFNHRQLALLSHAIANPDASYRVTSHANSHQITRQTARTDLNELVEMQLLWTETIQKAVIFHPFHDIEERLQSVGTKAPPS
ncbi:MAG: Fic family protein [Planctomycetes bacterium]|nr:Fic family protein [Planctomycetota bacterium]